RVLTSLEIKCTIETAIVLYPRILSINPNQGKRENDAVNLIHHRGTENTEMELNRITEQLIRAAIEVIRRRRSFQQPLRAKAVVVGV
ncbi:MAG: hypothetical protein AB1510_11150, partial [Bacillota bacterium]